MIERMRCFNITGPTDDLDRVLDEYLSNYDIQLEDAITKLHHMSLESFHLPNPYTEILRVAENLMTAADEKSSGSLPAITAVQAVETINKVLKHHEERALHIKEINARLDKYNEYLELLGHFTKMNFELEKIRRFRFIGCRFGHMPYTSFRQFEAFLYDEPDILYIECERGKDVVWAMYFVPDESKAKVDAIFSSLHFERVHLTEELDGEHMSGTPAEIYEYVRKKSAELEKRIHEYHQVELAEINITSEQLWAAYLTIKDCCYHCEARKYAAKSGNDFYVLVGWMSENDAFDLDKKIQGDEKVVFIIAEDHAVSEAPTRLRNNPLFRPFEFFVRMYGLPSYGEIDPTPFVAMTYTVLFGLMFGDLGQGAVLAALGLYLYHGRKLNIGAIMATIGVSSMIFGILYGSIFGLEEIIPAVWMRPASSINRMLFVTIALGVGLVACAMLLNMWNAYRRKDWFELLLGPNGVCGLLFYAIFVFSAWAIFSGIYIPGTIIAVIAAVPLIFMALRKPVLQWRDKVNKTSRHGGTAMLVFETIIEMFEVLLSYFTNTLSFIRVGAFALSHTGMMAAIMILAENANTGQLNPIVLILGNIFVIALEGLVVGIQALRLEFYEMFSRFFNGGGREFVSYRSMKR